MSDIFQRLKGCKCGMGTRNPDDCVFWMNVTEASEVADKIAELKAENDLLQNRIHNLYYSEASQKGVGHHQADDYAKQMIESLNK